MSRYASINFNGTKEQERCSLVEIKKRKKDAAWDCAECNRGYDGRMNMIRLKL